MKKIVSLLIALILVVSCAAVASAADYLLVGGSGSGNFMIVGNTVTNVINNTLPNDFTATAEATGGGKANVQGVSTHDLDFGVTMTSTIKNGVAEGATTLRGALPLYPSYLTIYTPASSGIKCLQDLNGKVVGLGSKGAAMDNVWRKIFEQLNIVPKSIFNDNHNATATAMKNGDIEAAILYSLPPFGAIAELEASTELNFIGLTDEEQATLVATYEFYSPAVMPAGSYKGVPEDLTVVSEWNVLVTSSEVPEEVVYKVVKTLFENNDQMVASYKGLAYATLENVTTFNWECPLHAGLVRYLTEQGIEVPESMIPPEYTK